MRRTQDTSTKDINKGHPAELLVPVWFPAIMKMYCACNGCEDCQEDLARYRHFIPVINPEIGI